MKIYFDQNVSRQIVEGLKPVARFLMPRDSVEVFHLSEAGLSEVPAEELLQRLGAAQTASSRTVMITADRQINNMHREALLASGVTVYAFEKEYHRLTAWGRVRLVVASLQPIAKHASDEQGHVWVTIPVSNLDERVRLHVVARGK